MYTKNAIAENRVHFEIEKSAGLVKWYNISFPN